MIAALAFTGLAATAALVRWQLTAALPRPAATLLVNLIGAFVLGLVAGWAPPALTVIGVGGLGSLTTFSTLADDVVVLWHRDRTRAVGYMAVTLVGGIAAAAAGLALA